jgi:hypothetical protein
MCSGLVSTFSTTYGISADNFTDAEFVSNDGSFFSLNDSNAPNLFSYHNVTSDKKSTAVCISVSMKLHPVTQDECGILVPFETLEKALDFARDCSVRHIGLAIGILGSEFVSSFCAPTKKLANQIKDVFTAKLGMPYMVLMIGDAYALRSVKEMGLPVIDQKLFTILCLGMPALKSASWLNLLREISDDEPFSYLRLNQFSELAETALAPSPALLCGDIDPEMLPFFEKLYSRPEMTDLAWLNTFRITSTRVARENPFVGLVFYLPIDNALILQIIDALKTVAGNNQIKSEIGFITPIDNGKRCVLEYDYYFNHNDTEEVARIQQAAYTAGCILDDFALKTGTIRWIRYVVNEGCSRKENLLYI